MLRWLQNYRRDVEKVRACTNLTNAQLEFQSKYFFKPLSFWVSPFLIYCGFTAHKVTLLRFALSFFACFAYARWFYQGHSLVCPILFFLVFLLDQVDGNLVRYHDNSDWSGKFMDGAVDISFENFAPFFIGMGAFAQTGNYEYWIWAAAASVLGLQYRFFSERRKRVTLKMREVQGQLAPRTQGLPRALRSFKLRLMDPLMTNLPYVRKYIFAFSIGILTFFSAKVVFYVLIPALIICYLLQILDTFLIISTKLNFHRISGLSTKKNP